MIESIQALRTEGKLEEALVLAEEYLANNPEDEAGKLEMAWIQYGYVKKAAKAGELEAFHQHLDIILAQKLEGQGVMGNSLAWQVHRISKKLLAEKPFHFEEIAKLLEKVVYFTFDIEEDIMAYVMMLRLALKAKDHFPGLRKFIDWWNLDNLPEAEYEPFNTKQGRRMMSLAERSYLTYARCLMQWFDEDPVAAREVIKEYFPRYERLIIARPDYNFARYFRPNLLLGLGEYDELERELINQVKYRSNDMRTWHLLGKSYEHQGKQDQALACYAMILSGRSKPELVAMTKIRMGFMLIKRDLPVEAKTEFVDAIRAHRMAQVPLPPAVEQVQEEEWFQQTEGRYHNRGMYRHFLPFAQEILYSSIPEHIGVVTHVDMKKKRAWFRVSQQISGNGSLNQFGIRVAPGDFIAVRLEEKTSKDGSRYYGLLTCRKTEDTPEAGIVRYFSGRFSMRPGQTFGFVDREIFVPPHLVEANLLIGGQFLSGMAVLEYDQKRDRWSWKAVQAGGEDRSGDRDGEHRFRR